MSDEGSQASMLPQLLRSIDEAQKLLARRDYKSAREALLPGVLEALDDKNRDFLDEVAVRLLGPALHMLGTCDFELEGPDEAREAFELGLGLAVSLQDELLTASFLHELSLVAYKQGNLDEALRFCKESIEKAIDNAFVEIGQGLTPGYIDFDLNQLGVNLNQLAVLYQETGKFDQALDILTIVRAHCERVYNLELLGGVLNELGMTCFALGRYSEGVRYFLESIKIKAKQGQNSAAIAKSTLNLQVCLANYPEALRSEDVSQSLKEYRP